MMVEYNSFLACNVIIAVVVENIEVLGLYMAPLYYLLSLSANK
jgi:hypothetical protein